MKHPLYNFDCNKYLDHFSKEETVQSIVSRITSNNGTFSSIEKKYTFDEDRCGLIVQMTDKNTKRLSRVIIDIKHGKPTYQQLLEMTFDIGNDCDYSVAIFDDAHNENDEINPSACAHLAGSLVNLLNAYGGNAYLAILETEDDKKLELRYLLMLNKHLNRKGLEMPSKREFECAEFWTVYFDSVPTGSPSATFCPEYWLDYQPYRIIAGLKIIPTWTDDGFFMDIFSETEPELLEWLLEYKGDKIREFVNQFQAQLESYEGAPACGSEIIVDKKSGVMHKLSVMLTGQPFKEFVYSSVEKKKRFAEMVYYTKVNFYEFIEKLLEDRGSNKKTPNDSCSDDYGFITS